MSYPLYHPVVYTLSRQNFDLDSLLPIEIKITFRMWKYSSAFLLGDFYFPKLNPKYSTGDRDDGLLLFMLTRSLHLTVQINTFVFRFLSYVLDENSFHVHFLCIVVLPKVHSNVFSVVEGNTSHQMY